MKIFKDVERKEIEDEQRFKDIKQMFFGFLAFSVVLTVACNVYRAANPPKAPLTVKITTCEEAKQNLKEAWDERDSIPSHELLTKEGKRKWEELRDAGVKALRLKELLCGS